MEEHRPGLTGTVSPTGKHTESAGILVLKASEVRQIPFRLKNSFDLK